MDDFEKLQIGHSAIKEDEFRIQCGVANDTGMEVPFSHRHLFYALYWIHNGCGTHIIDFSEYDIKPDRIFFVRPEQIHILRGDSDLKYSALQFTEDFMVRFLSATNKIDVFVDVTQNERSRIDILFKQIQLEYDGKLQNYAAIIQSEINTLLLEMERLSIPYRNTSVIPGILQKYKKLIDGNYINCRTVRDYAMQLGVSPNYLNILAKRHLGKSALEMINERIMLEIKRLLLRTDCNISEIACKLGFNEVSYFSRFFKQNTGITPHEFRTTMNKLYQR